MKTMGGIRPARRTWKSWTSCGIVVLALALGGASAQAAPQEIIHTLGNVRIGVDVTNVSGTGPWTLELSGEPVLDRLRVHDMFQDRSNSNIYSITAIDDAGNTITVIDQEQIGVPPATGIGAAGA